MMERKNERDRKHSQDGAGAIAKLRPVAQKLGGDIIEVKPIKFKRLFDWQTVNEFRKHKFEEAPAQHWHGVNYDKKLIFVVPQHATANALIHEMGHVFASDLIPDDSDEFSFLGWEACLAIKVGLYRDWSRLNDGYGLYNDVIDGDWGQANAKTKAKVLRECIKDGIDQGIIEAGTLEPLSCR